MGNKFKTMLQIRRILQLLSKGEKPYSISKELGMSKNTIKTYRTKFQSTKQTYNQLLELDDDALALIAYPKQNVPKQSERLELLSKLFPDYLKRLKNTHSTRETLWNEYRKKYPDGYSYSQFCEHLSRYIVRRDATMYLVHKPANELQIDFAGDKLKYINRSTGEIIACPVLVCTLPFSGYTYVEALPNMSQVQLLGALNSCLNFLGGVPVNICSDNLKQVVNKPDKYEPKFSELIDWFALHYNTSFTATRVMKPKDKAMVERHVGIVYTRIYAIIEQQEYYSLEELNHAIREQLDIFNSTKLQRKDYSRRELFDEDERKLLSPLPNNEFEIKHKTRAKVQKNYHIILGEDWHNYSVPYRYIGQKVEIIYDTYIVEIYKDFKRIAFHKRNFGKHQYTTLEEHMPENHKISKQIGGYTPDDFLEKAKKIGEDVHKLIEAVINNKFFSQQTFKSCLGILRLENKYGKERLEKASQMALNSHKANYRTVKNILENNRDKLITEKKQKESVTSESHDNIRGSGFYSNLFSTMSDN
jgi:transposase